MLKPVRKRSPYRAPLVFHRGCPRDLSGYDGEGTYVEVEPHSPNISHIVAFGHEPNLTIFYVCSAHAPAYLRMKIPGWRVLPLPGDVAFRRSYAS